MTRRYQGRSGEMKAPASALEGKLQSALLTAKRMLEGIKNAGDYLRKDAVEGKGVYFPSDGYDGTHHTS